jgi:dynein heavy chain
MAELKESINDCIVKIDRAKTLLESLDEEKERWKISLSEVKDSVSTIEADVLLAAACIAYLGPYTQTYRQRAIDSWLVQMMELDLTTTDEFSITKVLGDPLVINEWQMNNLPKDSFSVENGIIMNYGKNWPLMIDP